MWVNWDEFIKELKDEGRGTDTIDLLQYWFKISKATKIDDLDKIAEVRDKCS